MGIDMDTNIPLERLVAVETKLDMLIESNKEVAKSLKSLQSDYVRKREYEADLADVKLKIENTRQKSALHVWLTSTLAAVFGIVMTLLVQNYFS